MQHMLLQHGKVDIYKNISAFDKIAEEFKQLPMVNFKKTKILYNQYYMNFYGTTDINKIIDTIEYAIYKY